MKNPDYKKYVVATTTEIREHFPALERLYNNFPVAYFDGPGGTQIPRVVAEKMVDYLYHHNANTHWAYPTSIETDAALQYARRAAADFLNASPNEIVFGANMTTLTFHLSRAIGRSLSPGDEIVVTELDHHANIDPWHILAAERDLTIRTVRMDPVTCQLDWEHYDRILNERTKLVALGAASNAFGTINDINTATQKAHDAGALIFIDAVHYAPHVLTDVRAIDCDFLACSAYKFNGPHIGILYGKQKELEAIEFAKLAPASDSAPERAETGTLNHEGIVGAAAAIDFFASLSQEGESRRERLQRTFSEHHAREGELLKHLWHGLSNLQGVRLYGPHPGEDRTPTLAFIVEGFSSGDIARRLAERGVFVSNGDFYASTAVEKVGQGKEGLVRAGCAIYTTPDEVDRLIESVSRIL